MSKQQDVKVVIGDTFLESFARLPSQAQKHTSDFLVKFRSNPTSAAIHYEKIASKLDKKVWSVRVDDTYRGIVIREEETGVFMLIWVDHHDEAYKWAARKRCNINPFTGAIQLYTVQEIVETLKAACIFGEVTKEEYLELGVPEEQVDYVRSLTSKDAFLASKNILTPDVFEGLSWLLEDIPAKEVIEMMQAERDKGEPKASDLRTALESAENQRFFRVVEGEEDLQAMLNRPLDKWRVFLHPTQRRIVNKDYSGAARTTGGAGTGKTVVAMHRAKRLAAGLSGHERVLFTTFTANLAADIRDNLSKICSNEELRHNAFSILSGIDFDNLDGEALSNDKCQSLTHGEVPVVKNCRSANSELEFIVKQIRELEQGGVSLKDICLTARTHSMLDNYLQALTREGIRCYELKKEKTDDRQQDGIRLATMHRVKGLEFQYMFVAGMNKGVMPIKQVTEIDEPIAKQEAMIAEKCLLYVALTRAQRGAFITSYGKTSEFLI